MGIIQILCSVLAMKERKLEQSVANVHWKKIGVRHHHGICVSLSALHDSDTGGIGDFHCLLPVIEWCAAIGLDVLQILPINDTGNSKSPYSLKSAFALNPVYLDVNAYALPSERKYLKSLNELKRVSYQKVRDAKLSILRRVFREEKQKTGTRIPWLKTYARRMGRGDQEAERFYIFVQKLCYSQMKQVKRFAEKKRILIKGDLPILISPSSIDCKEHPDYFLKELAVGAPPDSFSSEGQNWGFPVYNFEERLEEIEEWWIKRLKLSEQIYHLYRIDHVVGFFRQWAIEKGKSGKDGFFIPRSQKRWYSLGERLLTHFLSESPLFPIAEDLGSVPLKVKACLEELGIPGTKVMRWEKEHPKNYSACSMTTVSTHDTQTLKEWWQKFPDESRCFCLMAGFPWKKRLDKETQKEVLKLSHQSSSLFHINLLQEYFPLAAGLSRPNPEQERINIPGKRRGGNWSYRYKPSISEFTKNDELFKAIKELLL